MEDGSFLAQGYAPTKHTVKMTVKTDDRADPGDSPRAAQRPEPAAVRPGPLDQGDGGPDRIQARWPRRLMAKGKAVDVKIVRRHRRRQSARDAAGCDL